MTLAHDVSGSGSPVLLLHSTVCDRRMWDPQIAALVAAGHRVVRCDLHGYGDSPVPATSWSDAEDVLGLLDELGVDRFALVGASGGGRVGLAIAARVPQRVTKLVLLATALHGHVPGAQLSSYGAQEDELLAAGDVTAATELNVRTWLGPDAGPEVREKLRQMQRHAFEVQLAADPEVGPVPEDPDLAAITAPVLIVSGRHDLPDFREIAAGLADRFGARHVELDTGHLPSLEDPAAVNALLTDFL
ncbi:alpha/beta fold hydrolase [Actinoplanes sp. N902-109]|uniref:alpha/beta fold hydrolase n=1 Tax=Actinoplanes sp. (strain N902-109) TaxID=649831 RepID=UPI0003295F08|nr:alpha/beta hydrolase [Actinoplanes sp. N902-109]AGL17821.1 3-oxoadipate enol-lactonase [Actinoplanes sp. N902-109]